MEVTVEKNDYLHERIAHAHDKFVRRTMSNLSIAQEFFSKYLPADILDAVHLNSLEIMSSTFISESRKRSTADLLYRVKWKDRDSVAYFIVEHQSSHDRSMPWRILKYMINVIDYDMQDTGKMKIPFVYSFVIYHGRTQKCHPTELLQLIDIPIHLQNKCVNLVVNFIDLNLIDDETMLTNTQFGLVQYFLKHIFKLDLLPYVEKIKDDLKLLAKNGYGNLVFIALEYAMDKGEISDLDRFNQLISQISLTVEDEHMTYAEQIFNKGREKGFEEGYLDGEIDLAKRLVAAGIDPILLAKTSGLDVQTILSDE